MLTLCVMELLDNTVVLIILQFINESNQHSVHRKLTQCMCQLYLSKDGKKCFPLVVH